MQRHNQEYESIFSHGKSRWSVIYLGIAGHRDALVDMARNREE